ncbi:MAG: hypothetical protein GX442_07830 [Candidatus Riflebacteria bacterium]|nr:hypothetical protein [Candidatus Riflebacteria bacterium]
MNGHDACTAFRLAASARFDGEPAPEGTGAPDPAHERECPACRAFVADLERLHRPLSASRDPALPARLRDRLTAAAAPAAPAGSSLGARLRNLFAGQPFLAPALGLVALLFLVLLGRGRNPAPLPFSVKHLRQATLEGGLLSLETKGEAALTTPAGRVLRIWGGPGRIALDALDDRGVALRQEEGRLCCHWESRTPIPFRLGFGQRSALELVGTTWRLDLSGSASPPGPATIATTSTLAITSAPATPVSPDRASPATPADAVLAVADGKVRILGGAHPVDVIALQQVRISPSGEVSEPEAFNPFTDPDLGLPPTQIWIGER